MNPGRMIGRHNIRSMVKKETSRARPSRCSTAKGSKTFDIDVMISEYKAEFQHKCGVDFEEIESIGDCVTGSHNELSAYATHSSAKLKRHSHQNCLSTAAIKRAVAVLEAVPVPSDVADFEQLYKVFRPEIIKIRGLSDLAVYDTALRYAGSFLRIRPKKYVYLHRGAFWGARDLRKISKLTGMPYITQDIDRSEGFAKLPISAFCPELAGLGSAYLEDFLCVYHSCLKEWLDSLTNNHQQLKEHSK